MDIGLSLTNELPPMAVTCASNQGSRSFFTLTSYYVARGLQISRAEFCKEGTLEEVLSTEYIFAFFRMKIACFYLTNSLIFNTIEAVEFPFSAAFV